MATIIVFERYSPGNSPMTNETVKKLAFETMGKLPALTEKHGIKTVGMWSVLEEQLNIYVYEAPSVDAFREFMMEPDIMKWS